jgi:hypothetical protein
MVIRWLVGHLSESGVQASWNIWVMAMLSKFPSCFISKFGSLLFSYHNYKDTNMRVHGNKFLTVNK